MERRLGRGLGTLLGEQAAEPSAGDIPLDRIRPNPYQPRKTIDPAGLEELSDSIRAHGLLQPVVVRRQGQGFELIAGERRWRAARKAGLERIPAVVKEAVSDGDMLELALVENVQRSDLDPIERARAFRALMDNLGLTQEEIAAKVGLRRATVANLLRLLELPAQIQEAVAQGILTAGHAKALLGFRDQSAMLEALEQTVRGDLSVREVESLASAAERKRGPKQGARNEAAKLVPWLATVQGRLQDALGSPVTVRNGASYRGSVVIEYFSRADLDRLIERLAPQPRL